MLTAFIDDSQSNCGDESFHLAGYVLDAESWSNFIQEWDSALLEHPAITHLHMKDANSLRGEFRGWSKREKDGKLYKLACVIGKYKPLSVEVSLSRRQFIKATGGRVPYNLRTPYFMCFWVMLATLCRYLISVRPGEKLNVVFDDQGGLGINTLQFYEMIKELNPDIYGVLAGTPRFANDVGVSPIQAADMLVWFLRRENESHDEVLLPIAQLTSEHVRCEITEDHIVDMADKMAAVPNVEGTVSKSDWRKYKKPMVNALQSGEWRQYPQTFKNFKWPKILVWITKLTKSSNK